MALLPIDSLLLHFFSLLQVFLSLSDNVILRGEIGVTILLEIVATQQLANPEPDLSLGPFFQVLLLDLLELAGPKLNDALDELLIFLVTPVMAFFYVEVLEVEAAISEADIVFAQTLAHIYYVLQLLLVQSVVNGADTPIESVRLRQEVLLGNQFIAFIIRFHIFGSTLELFGATHHIIWVTAASRICRFHLYAFWKKII